MLNTRHRRTEIKEIVVAKKTTLKAEDYDAIKDQSIVKAYQTFLKSSIKVRYTIDGNKYSKNFKYKDSFDIQLDISRYLEEQRQIHLAKNG